MERTHETRKNGTRRVIYHPDQENQTCQSDKKACDINTMMARAEKGQFIPPQGGPGAYGDFTGYGDYMECRNKILAAEATFFALPADLRKRFNNDPAEVIEFMEDPSNLQECYRLGLLAEPEEDAAAREAGTATPVEPREVEATPSEGA